MGGGRGQEGRQSEDSKGVSPGVWEGGVSRALGGVSWGPGLLAGMGCRLAEESGAQAAPGQVPWAGQTRSPHWVCGMGKGGTQCPSAPSQGCSWHRSTLEADHMFS